MNERNARPADDGGRRAGETESNLHPTTHHRLEKPKVSHRRLALCLRELAHVLDSLADERAAALGLGKPRPLAVAHDIYFSRQSKLFKSLESRGPPYGVGKKLGCLPFGDS